jgi:hypothetical protein
VRFEHDKLLGMALQRISVEAQAAARPEAVFAVVADGSLWPTCTPLGSFRLETQGEEGTGSVRVFRTLTVTAREQIVECEAPHHLGYVLLSASPSGTTAPTSTSKPRRVGRCFAGAPSSRQRCREPVGCSGRI